MEVFLTNLCTRDSGFTDTYSSLVDSRSVAYTVYTVVLFVTHDSTCKLSTRYPTADSVVDIGSTSASGATKNSRPNIVKFVSVCEYLLITSFFAAYNIMWTISISL